MLLSRAARSLRRLEHVKGLQKKGRVTSCVQIQISRPRRLMGTPKGDYEKENILTVPNFLSLGRIVMTPVLGYLVISCHYTAALGVFTVAGLTDLVDGYIARTFEGQSSSLGSVLDPLADKCLISVLCITLTMASLLPVPLAVVILGRDVILVLASFYLRYITIPPPVTWSRYWDIERSTVQVTPSFLGKVNTVLQLILLASSLASPVFGVVGHPLLTGLGYVTGLTTFGSGVHYLYQYRGFKVLHSKSKQKPS